MRRALFPLLLIASLSAAGFRAQGEPPTTPPATVPAETAASEETFSLYHKPALGEIFAVVMKLEMKFGEVNIVSTSDLSQKITEVSEDGSYTVEITSGEETTTVNGQAVESEPSDEPKTTTQRFDINGKRIVPEGEEDESVIGSKLDYQPKSPVKIGESWKTGKADDPDPMEWTLTGKEDVGGKPLLLVQGKGKGDENEMIESKVWLDPVTFIERKSIITIRGIKQEDGSEGEMTISFEEKA